MVSDLNTLREELRTQQSSSLDSVTLKHECDSLRHSIEGYESQIVKYKEESLASQKEQQQVKVTLDELQKAIDGMAQQRQEQADENADLEKELDLSKKQIQTKSGEIQRLHTQLIAANSEIQNLSIENEDLREANDGLYSDNERYGNEVEELMQHNNHIEQELIMLKQRVDTSNATVHTDSDGNRSTSYVSPESTEAHMLAMQEKLQQAQESNEHTYERDMIILQNELSEQKIKNEQLKQMLSHVEQQRATSAKLVDDYMAENEALRESINKTLTATAIEAQEMGMLSHIAVNAVIVTHNSTDEYTNLSFFSASYSFYIYIYIRLTFPSPSPAFTISLCIIIIIGANIPLQSFQAQNEVLVEEDKQVALLTDQVCFTIPPAVALPCLFFLSSLYMQI